MASPRFPRSRLFSTSHSSMFGMVFLVGVLVWVVQTECSSDDQLVAVPTSSPVPTIDTRPTPSSPDSGPHRVSSNGNEVDSRIVSLPTGNYKLAKTSGCSEAKLVRHSDDVSVIHLSNVSSTISGVSEGLYTLSATGNGCWATLTRYTPTPTRPTQTPRYTAPSRASTYYSLESDGNIPRRGVVWPESGTYTLSTNGGCLLAELAFTSNDALVISVSRSSSKPASIQSGRYAFRAIGNGCRATLRR